MATLQTVLVSIICDCGVSFDIIAEHMIKCPMCKQSYALVGLPEQGLKLINGMRSKETCPDCDSSEIYPVPMFDYMKQCEDCGKEFVSTDHN